METFCWRLPCARSSCGIACERQKSKVLRIQWVPCPSPAAKVVAAVAVAADVVVNVGIVAAVAMAVEAVATDPKVPVRVEAMDRSVVVAVVVVAAVAEVAAKTADFSQPLMTDTTGSVSVLR